MVRQLEDSGYFTYGYMLSDLFNRARSQSYNVTEEQNFNTNHENQNEDLDSEISENEIKCAIFSQKNNKSTGTDQLCSELFKALYDIISPFLLALFNRWQTVSTQDSG